jgi:peptidoglycan hydrolase-like protein with peptidoglycan-binding domain
MPSFHLLDSGYTPAIGWRPLRYQSSLMAGWDVFDLQARFKMLGYALTVDGYFGPETKGVVRMFQGDHHLVVDGVAGLMTQTTSGAKVAAKSELPKRVLGQMSKECSLLCGIYTPVYKNGSQDRGPVQENSQFWPNTEEAFDVRKCLPTLVAQIKNRFAVYFNSNDVPEDRAWAAAQGYWNSHVYADLYAANPNDPRISAGFLDYIEAVTAYV